MMDLKTLRSALEQLEEERGITQDKIIGAIEDALVAAYKKDYGKKGQIVRAKFDLNTGKVDFYQVKIAVDETMLESEEEKKKVSPSSEELTLKSEKIKFNEDQHLLLVDAQKIKKDIKPGDELIFPLETKEDYGRIAAQTAKQVIIQRLREAEKVSVLAEYADRVGTILSGKVQKLERGNVFVDLKRTVGLLPYEEQIPGEHYQPGERVRAYLMAVEETPRGIRVNTVINELGGEKIDIIPWSENPRNFIEHALAPAKITNLILNEENREAIAEVEPDQFSLAVGKKGQNVRLAAKLTGWRIDIKTPVIVEEGESLL